MAPPTALARPPFAVDDHDTQYVDRTPRTLNRPREERNKVSESQYNAYDNYFDSNDDRKPSSGAHLAAPTSGHRSSPSADSSLDAIGDGFLAALGDSDDDSDDDSDHHPSPSPVALSKKPASPVAETMPPPKSKNQALFEAAVADEKRSLSPLPPAYDDDLAVKAPSEKGRQLYPQGGPSPNLQPDQHHPQQQPSYPRGPSPTPPPPAAPLQVHIPVSQMGAPQPKRPIQPGATGPQQGLTIVPPPAAHPMYGAPTPNGTFFQGGPGGPGGAPYSSPGFQLGMGPTPIPAQTSTPIQPVFIKPIKPAFLKSDSDENEKASVMSHDSAMPIMRSDKEDYLPLRSDRRIPRVGEKVAGDEFWRRFSMVVKSDRATPANKKKSEWLNKHSRGTSSLSRWVWCVGLFALLLIIGGSVAGWWFSRGSPAHQVPVAIGGGAEETMTAGGTTPDPTPVDQQTSTTKTTAKSKATSTESTTDTRKRASDDYVAADSNAGVKQMRAVGKSHRRRAPTAHAHLH